MKVKKLNNLMVQSIGLLGSATFLNAILVFTVEVFTRNLLGPEKYGYWMTISLLFTIMPIFQLGTLNAMNREVPFYLARNDYEKVKEIRENVFSFIITIPFLLVVCLLIISFFSFAIGEMKFEYKIGLVFAAIITGFTYLSSYTEMYYKSEQNFKKLSKLVSIKVISQSLFTISLVYLLGYIGLYLGMLIALIIEIIVGKEVFPAIKKVASLKEYKNLIQIGFPILIVGLVWSLMIATDRVFIALFMDPEDLGNYGVGMLIFSSMMLLPQVISQVMYPKIVELVSREQYQDIMRIYLKLNKALTIVMLGVVFVGYMLLPYLIGWLLPHYTEGIKAAQVLVLGIFPLTLVNLAANYFNATSNQKIYLMIQVISLVVNILLSLLFLYIEKSIISVSLATSISFVIYSILMNGLFWLKIKKNLK